MMHPVLTLLVASSIQWAFESPRQADLAQIVIEITQAVQVNPPAVPQVEAEPTVCDVPYYYDDFRPLEVPGVPFLITYDWRSPVIFDLP